MHVYMTNGTLPFLIKLEDKHPNIDFYFMKNSDGILAYYEGSKKKVFASGRSYQTIESDGNIQPIGFVMMDHIPIQSDSKPVFEEQLPKLKRKLLKAPGLYAFRILKQRRQNVYLILSQWDKEASYDAWQEQNSDLFVKKPAYFSNRRFTQAYYIIDEETLNEHRK